MLCVESRKVSFLSPDSGKTAGLEHQAMSVLTNTGQDLGWEQESCRGFGPSPTVHPKMMPCPGLDSQYLSCQSRDSQPTSAGVKFFFFLILSLFFTLAGDKRAVRNVL